MKTDPRSFEELRRQYELEQRLAHKLRHAVREERRSLYREAYDEFYREFPFLKTNPATVDEGHLRATLRILKPFLGKDKDFLEIGAGNLAVSRAVSTHVRTVYAIDVSKEFATALGAVPKNVHLIISDGVSIPVPSQTTDVAYSSQLMEHLHPDDAKEQLRNIYEALKPGGVYICNTPNRLNGPHDISKDFDPVATGFHLKEYTNGELARLFRMAGFTRVWSLTGAKGFVIRLPVGPLIALERVLGLLPDGMRKTIGRWLPIKILLLYKL